MANAVGYFSMFSSKSLPIFRHGCRGYICRGFPRVSFSNDRLSLGKLATQTCINTGDQMTRKRTSKRFLGSPLTCGVNYGVRYISTSREFLAQEPWMISDYEVNSMISAEESACEIKDGLVERFEGNHLGSNKPIEDRKFVAKLLHEDGGYLFGVLDGHGGDACAENVCQRICDYIALGLLRPEVLSELTSLPKLVEYMCMTSKENNEYSYVSDPACQHSLDEYFGDLQGRDCKYNNQSRSSSSNKQKLRGLRAKTEELHDSHILHRLNALTNAFLTLDNDVSREALTVNDDGEIDKHSFAAANSGACALVTHINGTELCIANTGDCRAVLGVQNDDNTWSAIQLTSDHTAGNPEEVQRILSQHPQKEATTCIQYERLLRRLAPLRSFGDARFKWDVETQRKIYRQFSLPHFTEKENFFTPPYLTVEPEVTTYQLQLSDKFLVLATDGLWDMLSNEEVIYFVKEHMNKKDNPPANNQPYQITFNEQELPCELTNSASCLIREALGGDDHVAVSTVLSIPHPDVRLHRDDMTVIVVFFDWDQLEVPSEEEDTMLHMYDK